MAKIEEIWKDVSGYEGTYQVSSIGNVRSFPHSNAIKSGSYHKGGNLKLSNKNKHYFTGLAIRGMGESASNSILKEFEVLLIRKLSKEGVSRIELSKQFKVNRYTIKKVVNNVTWRHLL